jgi:putative ABC transport system substrate-binding protein
LGTKRLEILKEALPHLRRVAMLSNPANASLVLQVSETEAAARLLGVQFNAIAVKSSDDLEAGVEAALAVRADAIITTSDSIQVSERARIVELAMRNRLPVIGEFREIAGAGALLSYGPNRVDMWRRGAFGFPSCGRTRRKAAPRVERELKRRGRK